MILQTLETLGIKLSDPPKPGGSYVSVNARGQVAYVAIQFPIAGDRYLYTGRLGKNLTTADGVEAARLSAVNVMAQLNKYIGFDRLVGLNHADIYYQAVDGWDDGPIVANGASDLFVRVLGESGRHTRAIFGVAHLPRNFAVGLTTSWTVKGDVP
jgi:enamine deaminase RidA (YjgF/YER057c/UK114 family)